MTGTAAFLILSARKAAGLIDIDGSYGEGGGQVLRTSLALSALLEKDVRVTNIRAKRPNPGLRAQHITAVKAVGALCEAEIEGLELGSSSLVFRPRRRLSGKLFFDVGTAGSITLVLQAMMPAAAFAPGTVELDLVGGTDVRWSPTVDYILHVVLPILRLMGYGAELQVYRRGHYPKGGGKVTTMITPARSLRSLTLIERGDVAKIRGVSHCVRLPPHVAERQAQSARQVLEAAGFKNAEIALESYPADRDAHLAPGSGMALFAETTTPAILGSDSLGERSKPAEAVGREAAGKLLEELRSGAAVDVHMGDILIPYLAVAEGSSTFKVSKISLHTITNIGVTELISGVKFDVEGSLDSPGRVSVKGIGLRT